MAPPERRRELEPSPSPVFHTASLPLLANPERWPLSMSRFEVVPNLSDEIAYCSIAIEAGSRNPRHQQLYSARDRLEDLSLQ